MAALYPNSMQGAQSVTYSAADMAGMNTPDQRPTAQQDDSINTPPEQNFNTPAMAGSMQQFLADNLGQYVIIEFLVGTQAMTQKAGVLYAVGSSVVTLFEEVSQTFVTCDIFAVKFVTFFLPGHRPWHANQPMFPTSGMQGVARMQEGNMAPMPTTGVTTPTGTCVGGTCVGGY